MSNKHSAVSRERRIKANFAELSRRFYSDSSMLIAYYSEPGFRLMKAEHEVREETAAALKAVV